MKWSIIFFLLISVSETFAQDYERVDAVIQLYPERVENPEVLSKFISRDFTTDEDKIRAIYGWLINNITYDPAQFKAFDYSFATQKEGNKKEEKTRKNIIEQTLQNGTAVCEGYAMTFEKLCELQGIQNYLVRGDTKTNFNDIGRPFANNHMWNVAYIDGKPFLFDATWGAGKYNGKFIKEPTFKFYKAPPEILFNSHIPQDIEDAFLKENISREIFSDRPLILFEGLKFSEIEKPNNGIVDSAAVNGTVSFSIRCQPEKVSFLFDNQPKEMIDFKIIEGIATFEIPLQLGATTLLIYFDDKVALGYGVE